MGTSPWDFYTTNLRIMKFRIHPYALYTEQWLTHCWGFWGTGLEWDWNFNLTSALQSCPLYRTHPVCLVHLTDWNLQWFKSCSYSDFTGTIHHGCTHGWHIFRAVTYVLLHPGPLMTCSSDFTSRMLVEGSSLMGCAYHRYKVKEKSQELAQKDTAQCKQHPSCS
jgi:hypothetical protein